MPAEAYKTYGGHPITFICLNWMAWTSIQIKQLQWQICSVLNENNSSSTAYWNKCVL